MPAPVHGVVELGIASHPPLRLSGRQFLFFVPVSVRRDRVSVSDEPSVHVFAVAGDDTQHPPVLLPSPIFAGAFLQGSMEK